MPPWIFPDRRLSSSNVSNSAIPASRWPMPRVRPPTWDSGGTRTTCKAVREDASLLGEGSRVGISDGVLKAPPDGGSGYPSTLCLHEKSTDRFESPRSDDQSPPAGCFFFDPPISEGPGTEVGIDEFGIARLVRRSPVAFPRSPLCGRRYPSSCRVAN